MAQKVEIICDRCSKEISKMFLQKFNYGALENIEQVAAKELICAKTVILIL